MKKYLLSIAALLLGLLAHSQEADDLGNYAEVSVVTRLDLNPVFYKDATEFTLGNSSLYTRFTGSASEHFSWTLVNHWFSGNSFLGKDADPWVHFRDLGHSNTTNFIDMAYVDLMFGGWTFTLGKQCIATGGHEFDDDDWDVYTGLASPLWNSLACYQWGGTVAYTTPSELSTFSLQMTTSPHGERPFASGMWAWSAQWTGEYAWFAPAWSVSALMNEGSDPGSPRGCDWIVDLGNKFLLNQWSIELDWTNCVGVKESPARKISGNSFHAKVNYAPSERWNFALLGNFNKDNEQFFEASPWWNAGAIAEFFPLKDSDALRVHAYVAYDNLENAFMLKVGARYNLTFKLW